MNFRKGRVREQPEINLIAFIDVLLVILIFLMVTTTYSKFTAFQITLPTADGEKAVELPAEINVAVDARGQYAVDNSQIAARDPVALAAELTSIVAARGQSSQAPVVIINADAAAAHQAVINVLEAARLAGLERVTFAAQASGKH